MADNVIVLSYPHAGSPKTTYKVWLTKEKKYFVTEDREAAIEAAKNEFHERNYDGGIIVRFISFYSEKEHGPEADEKRRKLYHDKGEEAKPHPEEGPAKAKEGDEVHPPGKKEPEKKETHKK